MPAKKSKLLILGSTGLVGSYFINTYQQKYSIITLGHNNTDIKVNLLSKKGLMQKIQKLSFDAIINFAAYTNVDGAEKEKGDKNGEVYTLNSLLPLWLANYTKTFGCKLYHISTDYVFSGIQNNRPYTENDTPRPVNSWYAMTKYFGEENILSSDRSKNCAIVRISYPYSGVYRRKLDIARAVIERLKNKEPYFGIDDQKIKPASVDDITYALSFLLKKYVTGIYHVAGNFSPNEFITPYQFAQKIANTMSLDSSLIKPVSFLNLSKKRLAPRPQHTWLDTKKIESLGFHVTDFDEALKRFKNQMLENPLF